MLLAASASAWLVPRASPLPRLGPSIAAPRYAVLMSEKSAINDQLLAAESAWAEEAPSSAAAKKLAAKPGIGLAATQITANPGRVDGTAPEEEEEEAKAKAELVNALGALPLLTVATPAEVEENAAALADGASSVIDTFFAVGSLFKDAQDEAAATRKQEREAREAEAEAKAEADAQTQAKAAATSKAQAEELTKLEAKAEAKEAKAQ